VHPFIHPIHPISYDPILLRVSSHPILSSNEFYVPRSLDLQPTSIFDFLRLGVITYLPLAFRISLQEGDELSYYFLCALTWTCSIASIAIALALCSVA
jgi:hypothetical protein